MLPKIDKISNQTLNTGNQNNACAKKFFNTSKLGKENLETDVAAKKMGLRGPLISTDKSLNQTVIAKALQGSENRPIPPSTFVQPKLYTFNESVQAFGKSGFPVYKDDNACKKVESIVKQKVTESGSSKKSCSKGSNSKHLLAVEEFKFRTNSTKHQSRVAETVNKNLSRRCREVSELSLELIYNITYMSELLEFQYEKSSVRKLSDNFLKGEFNSNHRAVIIKFLIRVSEHYKYPSFILFQAVKIFDTYIDKTPAVKTEELQMICLAALWIALKKELINYELPSAAQILNLTTRKDEPDKKLLLECEKRILSVLKFEISFADPFSLLALISLLLSDFNECQNYKLLNQVYYFGSYIIDLTLLQEKFCNTSAILLATLSAEVAFSLCEAQDHNFPNLRWMHWRSLILSIDPVMEKTKLSDEEMNDIRYTMLRAIYSSKSKENPAYAVYRKYNTNRYGAISKSIVEKTVRLFLSNLTNQRA